MGILNCYCGGDLRLCHNHGETECFGCEDCEQNDGYTDDDMTLEEQYNRTM